MMRFYPVACVRALAVQDALSFYRDGLRYGASPSLLDRLRIDAHWQAQRLQSSCERSLGTRVR